MKRKVLLIIMLLSVAFTFAQVGINTEDPKATLDIPRNTTDGSKPEGLLIPRLSATQIKQMESKVGADQNSMLVFITDIPDTFVSSGKYELIDAPGYYYYDHSKSRWRKLLSTYDNTGLEKITENSRSGWRFIGANPNNYGDIGGNAVDLSYSEGASTEYGATGSQSFAVGRSAQSSGLNSIAMGFEAKALGSASVAIGEQAEAKKINSIAIGKAVVATEGNSLAMGVGAKAMKGFSVSIGFGTEALQSYSYALGLYTKAYSANSMALGFYNTVENKPTPSWNASDTDHRLFVIGNGWTSAESDAFTILRNGKVGVDIDNFETNKSDAKLQVNGKTLIGNFGDNATKDNTINSAGNARAQLDVRGDVAVETMTPSTSVDDKIVVRDNTSGVLKTIDRSALGKTYIAGAGINFTGTNSTTINAEGLERITKNGKTGWRLIGTDPTNYGNIGNNAVDLSISTHSSSDVGATGQNSVAMGSRTVASGDYSTAMGEGSKALGNYSIAAGQVATASGGHSVAMGYEAKAQNSYSNALGYKATASGVGSTAMGYEITASGNHSTAIGTFNVANDNNAFSLGIGNSSTGRKNGLVVDKNGRVAIGKDVTDASSEGLLQVEGLIQSEGIESADGSTASKVVVADAQGVLKTIDRSVLGKTYIAGAGINFTGTNSTTINAEGLEKINEGGKEGWRLIGANPNNYGNIGEGAVDLSIATSSSPATRGATGKYSTAMGNNTTASGEYSIAAGQVATASGGHSVAMGYEAKAIRVHSTALGYKTTASGVYSTAIGREVTASGSYSTAMGTYNVANDNNLFSLGAGGGETDRKNALVVSHQGQVAINKEEANSSIGAPQLQVNGLIQSEGIESADGSTASKVVVADAQGVLKTIDRSALVGTAENIYTTDGTVTGTRTVSMADDSSNITFTKLGSNNNNPLLVVNGTAKMMASDMNSDMRLKQNVTDLPSENIDELRSVSYRWNDEGRKRGGNDKLQYGFIAQEVEKVFPNLVSTDKDGYKSLNYVQIIPILTKAVQEERQVNKKQQEQLDKQAKEIEELKQLVNKLINK